LLQALLHFLQVFRVLLSELFGKIAQFFGSLFQILIHHRLGDVAHLVGLLKILGHLFELVPGLVASPQLGINHRKAGTPDDRLGRCCKEALEGPVH